MWGDALDLGSEEEPSGFIRTAFLLPLKQAEYKMQMRPLWGLCLLVFVGLGFLPLSAWELSGHAADSCPGS